MPTDRSLSLVWLAHSDLLEYLITIHYKIFGMTRGKLGKTDHYNKRASNDLQQLQNILNSSNNAFTYLKTRGES